MKYNDEILNKIAESYSKKIDENTNLDNVILGYLEMMKNGSKSILNQKIEVNLMLLKRRQVKLLKN